MDGSIELRLEKPNSVKKEQRKQHRRERRKSNKERKMSSPGVLTHAREQARKEEFESFVEVKEGEASDEDEILPVTGGGERVSGVVVKLLMNICKPVFF